MKTIFLLTIASISFFGTTQSLFERRTSVNTGIDFENKLTETDAFNFFHFDYFYNGGGVAVGDINNDGLQDIYFVGNQVQDRLYLNQGDLKFEDITTSSGIDVKNDGWHTGVTMADINNDGWLDIYVCRSGSADQTENLNNIVYINQKNNTFKELGKELGLDDVNRSVQATFLDYDRDGDLDVFVANHIRNVSFLTRNYDNQICNNSLFRNDNGKFTNVSLEASVSEGGFSIGVAVSDLNNDGWPDIYVSNDFMIADFVYINQKDGTFKNELKERFGHVPTFSMGVDIADINNDLLPDIYVADMASEDHIRSKRNMGAMNTEAFWENVNRGEHFQFMFNCLQLNSKPGIFREIAQLAHVAKTDWSWAPLFADFDNDGYKDLFVSNGIYRDVRNNDYNIEFNKKYEEGNEPFNALEELNRIPQSMVENYIFRNNGDLSFSKTMEDWELDFDVNSNGAAYADLDNDGDLELILNNVNQEALILENTSKNNSYVDITLSESELNPFGIGAKIIISTTSGVQMQELTTTRGFQSSVPPVCHFGLSTLDKIDNVKIQWSDGTVSIFNDLEKNKIIHLENKPTLFKISKMSANQTSLLKRVEGTLFKHQENTFNDFEREVLLPHKMSQLGPFLSKGDVNNDGKLDVYIGGAKGQPGKLIIQSENDFIEAGSQPWKVNSSMEEMGSAFFDIDRDNDQDLIVFSGGNEDSVSKSVIYINDGKGNFSISKFQLQDNLNVQKIIVSDINKDGWDDLIVGGRQVPGQYPSTPRSAIFINKKGRLVNKTGEIAPGFEYAGMITDMILFDYDNKRGDDLIVVGEWMDVTFFKNVKGVFKKDTSQLKVGSTIGWWNAILPFDIDNDGNDELLVGNIGGNNKYHPSQENPLDVFYGDFDQNGKNDIVLAKHQKEVFYPVRGRQCSSEQMPNILDKFPSYDEFAVAPIDKIYSPEKLNASFHVEAREFKSGYLKNINNQWVFYPFVNELQISPINSFCLLDITDDGKNELIVAGNKYEAEVETARYDAGFGSILKLNENGLEFIDPTVSGFLVNKNVKSMLTVDEYIFVGCNDDELIILKTTY